jgi:hypothetical protein
MSLSTKKSWPHIALWVSRGWQANEKEKRKKTFISVRGCWCGYWDPATHRPNGSMPNATPVFWSLSLSSYACHMTDATQGAGPSVVDRGVIVVPVVIVWSSPSLSSSSSSLSPSSSSPADPGPASGPGYPVIVVADKIIFFYWPISLSHLFARCHPRPHCSCRPVVVVSPSLSSNSSWSPSLLSASSGLSFHPASSWGCCGGGGVVGRGVVVSALSCCCNTVRSPRLM